MGQNSLATLDACISRGINYTAVVPVGHRGHLFAPAVGGGGGPLAKTKPKTPPRILREQKARQRALHQLSRAHPDHYRALLAAEKVKLSREQQGLPESVQDSEVLDVIARKLAVEGAPK